jgi:hypothetical protein
MSATPMSASKKQMQDDRGRPQLTDIVEKLLIELRLREAGREMKMYPSASQMTLVLLL